MYILTTSPVGRWSDRQKGKTMKTICRLRRSEAIEAIKNTETVMYKHGVWNPYYERKTAVVIKSIENSGYGAEVRFDEETGKYYVSIPCDSDMW